MRYLSAITMLILTLAVTQPVAAQEWSPTTKDGKLLQKQMAPAFQSLIRAAQLAHSALDKDIPKLEGEEYAASGYISLAIKKSVNTSIHIIEDLIAFTEIYSLVPLGHGIRLKIAPTVLARTKQTDLHLKALIQTHLSLGRVFKKINAPTLKKGNQSLLTGLKKAREPIAHFSCFKNPATCPEYSDD